MSFTEHVTGRVSGGLVAVPASLLLALSACADSSPSAEGEATEANADNGPQSGATSAHAQNAIPSALHGRWALKPDDCAQAGGLATGVLTITAKSMRFYETVAEPAKVLQQTPTLIRAQFAFSGEGVSWDREQSLELTGGNDTLVRQEYGMDAPTEPFTYSKCSNGE